ncbi:EFR1 family ferrodoxin [Acetivibrio cellulolyticus]|uniref:EFR1 family ferrodoxin n=1 Tax=Acetivibrio cellulolyticus TaxID=35830 RepID=UPI0001E2D428|nr:EFR1 family ferrodoxin [Acetivibrio cellulolyticus]
MNGCIVYFSATGNTGYVADAIKDEFMHRGIQCDIYEVSKKTDFQDKYDFYVFGSPIHAELFPVFYTEWVKKNITKGSGRKCIVYSTQGSQSACGPTVFANDLKKKGFEVIVEDCFFMPNNYYTVMFKKSSEQEIRELLKKSKDKAGTIVDKFLKDEKISNTAKGRIWWAKPVFKMFTMWSRKWAKNSLTVDADKCTRCGLCQRNCPVNNISIDKNNISFKDKCISCQRCIHKCPTNAFLHKKKVIEQYKLLS